MGKCWVGLVYAICASIGVCGELKVAILMQGSDFINITVVPLFDVDQFDLGDVFISPCRAGTYNEARDSYCKDCTVCSSNQYEREECVSVRNRVCANCTTCTEREQQVCDCRQRSPECVTGDRVCLPLPPTSATISFNLTVNTQLSPLKERFLQEGLRTGFVLFLGEHLRHSSDSISFMYLSKRGPRHYFTAFTVDDMYSLYTKRQVEQITQAVVQYGLTNTFGIQSNTFSTVSNQRRRRLLQQQPGPIELNVEGVDSQCNIEGDCPRFFAMSHPETPCESDCKSIPCPPGYTGFYGLCELCPNATYKETHGNDSCTACPAGFLSERGAMNSSQCTPPYTTPASVMVPATSTSTPNRDQHTTSGSLMVTVPISAATPSQPLALTTSSQAIHSSTPASSSSGTRHITLSHPVTGLPVSTPPAYYPPPSSTTPINGGGWPPWWAWGGGWTGSTAPPQVITNNHQIFNVSFVQNFFLTEWNTGHAGTLQYITINEEREEWALTMVVILMMAGFLSIGAIGARLFWLRPMTGPVTDKSSIVYEKEDGKKVIPLPVRRPPPAPSPAPLPSMDPPPSKERDRNYDKRPRPAIVPFVPLGSHALVYRRGQYDSLNLS